MPRSRLFRSIVVFGSSLGASVGLVSAASSLSSGCELYFPALHDHCGTAAWCSIAIDAGSWSMIEDGPWPFIDASQPDGWITIPDGPVRDAGPDAGPDAGAIKPDAGSGSS